MTLAKSMTWEELTLNVTNRFRWSNENERNEFVEWFSKKEVVGYNFDHLMVKTCYTIYKRLRKNKDFLLVNSGPEREGKTTLSFQQGALISDNFSNEYVTHTFDELIERLKNAPKYSTVISDEGGETFYSGDSQTKINKYLIKALMICGMKNLCLIINIPNFHLLGGYIRFHRTHLLIEVTKRGHYHAYVGSAITRISAEGYKYKVIVGIKCAEGTSWRGTFNKGIPTCINYEEYIKKKENYVDHFFEKELHKEQPTDDYIPASKLAKKLSIDSNTIISQIKSNRLEGKRIGTRYYVTKETFNSQFS